MLKTLLAGVTVLPMVTGVLYAADSPEPAARVDIGVGVSLTTVEYNLQTDFGQGFGLTLGVLFRPGVLLRFNVGRLRTQDAELSESVPGSNNLLLDTDTKYYHADATVGYLWNRTGIVRPYVRGGLGIIRIEATVHGNFRSSTLVSDIDQGFTIGGGVELGNGPHQFAVDYQVVSSVEVNAGNPGIGMTSLAFDYRDLRCDYRYRF